MIWRHLGCIWRHLEASGCIWRHLGGIWEASGRHLAGGFWPAVGSADQIDEIPGTLNKTARTPTDKSVWGIIILAGELCAEKFWPPPGSKPHADVQFPPPGVNVQKRVVHPNSLPGVKLQTGWIHPPGRKASGNVNIPPPGAAVQKRRIHPPGQIS